MPETACPKCGFPNRADIEKCANCFTSLKAQPSQTIQQRIPPQAGPVQPTRTGPNVGLIVIVLLLLAGAGVGAMLMVKGNHPQAPPKPTVAAEVVAEQFLAMKKTLDLAQVRPFLSAASKKKLDKSFDNRQARSAGFDKAEVAKMLLFEIAPSTEDLRCSKVTVSKPAQVNAESTQAVVGVKLEMQEGILAGTTVDYQLVMVNEAGEWKFDIDLTKDKNGLSDMAIPTR